MDRKLILVTGASGFIASYIVRDLLENGDHVRGTVRNSRRVQSEAAGTGLPSR